MDTPNTEADAVRVSGFGNDQATEAAPKRTEATDSHDQLTPFSFGPA
jgi:hypothetical protein